MIQSEIWGLNSILKEEYQKYINKWQDRLADWPKKIQKGQWATSELEVCVV